MYKSSGEHPITRAAKSLLGPSNAFDKLSLSGFLGLTPSFKGATNSARKLTLAGDPINNLNRLHNPTGNQTNKHNIAKIFDATQRERAELLKVPYRQGSVYRVPENTEYFKNTVQEKDDTVPNTAEYHLFDADPEFDGTGFGGYAPSSKEPGALVYPGPGKYSNVEVLRRIIHEGFPGSGHFGSQSKFRLGTFGEESNIFNLDSGAPYFTRYYNSYPEYLGLSNRIKYSMAGAGFPSRKLSLTPSTDDLGNPDLISQMLKAGMVTRNSDGSIQPNHKSKLYQRGGAGLAPYATVTSNELDAFIYLYNKALKANGLINNTLFDRLNGFIQKLKRKGDTQKSPDPSIRRSTDLLLNGYRLSRNDYNKGTSYV